MEESKTDKWDHTEALKAKVETEIAKVFPEFEMGKHVFRLNKKLVCYSSNVAIVLKTKGNDLAKMPELAATLEKVL
jgi:hypothetical protein